MKYSVILFLLIISSGLCFSQRKADIGLTGGTSYYQGDINPSRLFYKPRYNVGPIFRINFNTRYSLRFKAVYAVVAGSDEDFNYVITKRNYPVTFNAHFVNISSQVEYNFFNYTSGVNQGDWTPYIFGGFGYSYIISQGLVNSSISSTSHISVPFGIGTKMNLTRRLSAGLEWSYNKTFNDNLDGVASTLGKTNFYNNDWYSFFNIFITYKFFKFAPDCPAYD